MSCHLVELEPAAHRRCIYCGRCLSSVLAAVFRQGLYMERL
jgi:hypothetical protein